MAAIHQILKKYWGYDEFRPNQEEIINSILEGNDTVALMPTGGGKSLCFQLPAMIKDGLCLVVTPLIALMKDQVRELKEKNIPAAALYSGISKKETGLIIDNAANSYLKFLYLSPERLQNTNFLHTLKHFKVSFVVVDEAHCISQWGYDFRPAYLKIHELKELFPSIKFAAFTATATTLVQKDIVEQLQLQKPQVFKSTYFRENLSFSVFQPQDKDAKVLEVLTRVKGSAIVYIRNRKKCQQIADKLKRKGISADFYHAGLSFNERVKKQDMWMRNEIRVMVSTNAFGMGINKADVRIVIHYDLPEDPESYFQEAGRAGRDGIKSYAVVVYQQNDLTGLLSKIEESYPAISFIKHVYQCIANYYKIAIGSNLNESYDFEINHFVNTYSLDFKNTYFALQRLEKEGLILLNETFYNPSKVYFLLNNKELYDFQLANSKLDPLIKAILRKYGGEVFQNFISINEPVLGAMLGIGKEEVTKALQFLHKLEVLVYDQQKSKPQLCFLTPRYDAVSLPINEFNIQKLKEHELNKAQWILKYVVNTDQCRYSFLNQYFGEESDRDCEKCDICLKKKKKKTIDYDKHSLFILTQLEQGPIHITELLNQLPASEKDNVLMVIRELMDAQLVDLKNDILKKKQIGAAD